MTKRRESLLTSLPGLEHRLDNSRRRSSAVSTSSMYGKSTLIPTGANRPMSIIERSYDPLSEEIITELEDRSKAEKKKILDFISTLD